MPIAAGISAVGSLGAAGIGAYSSLTASGQQAQAAANALAFQQQVYQTNQTNVANQQATNTSNLSPYTNTGQSALYSLASLYGLPTPGNPTGGGSSTNAAYQAFTNLPAYQFPLQQGNLALSDQLNAQGLTQSGAQARETQQFGQGLASQYLMSNYVSPLMSLAGSGQNAATTLTNANSNLTSSLAGSNVQSGNSVGTSYGNIGTAQAAGTMGVGNALSAGLTGASSNLALYSALANGGSSYSSGGFNSPGSAVPGALGATSFGGISGPQPLSGQSSLPSYGPFQ